ncbi:MAG TPA: porin [Burkholderiales bacterium]|nr:porin [Burkholderiales bacterium]
MKKTLIALAVGSAFAAPAAFADVTISGSINAGPAYVHTGEGSTNAVNSFHATGAAAQQGVSAAAINTNYSNITIGSLEDLGGGLKLDFAYQLTANFQNTQAASNRNSHIGLVGDSWGGIWYGTNEQLYESYYYTVDPLDGAAGMGGNLQMLGTPGYNVVFDAPAGNPSACVNAVAGSGCAGFYRRDSQAIWYNSPNFNGFTGGVYATLPSAYKSAATTALPSINPWLWGIGGKYVGPSFPIQAWVAYEKHEDMFGLGAITSPNGAASGAGSFMGAGGGATSSSDYGAQLGVGYTFGDVFAYVNFEKLHYNDDLAAGGSATYKRNAWSIGAKWNLASGYVGGQFIQALNASCELPTGCTADHTSGKMVGVGYYHTLSKQTQAYIMATYIDNGDLNYFTTAGGAAGPYNLGSAIWGATVGLKHSF